MKDHSECIRGFTQLSKAWYGPANLTRKDVVDSFSIGFYHPDGGTTGEFVVEFKVLANKIVPQLNAFDDGWSALFKFLDMLEEMAKVDDENISSDDFNLLLCSVGIKDMTPIEDPDIRPELVEPVVSEYPSCLKEWLLSREEEIAQHCEDLGDLNSTFLAVIGREAK